MFSFVITSAECGVYGGDQSQLRTTGRLIGYAHLDPVLEYLL